MVGLYSNIYRPISFKQGMIVGTIQLYIQGHSWIQKKKDFIVHFLRNFTVDLHDIQYVTTTFWFVEAHAKFSLHKYYSRERTLLLWFYKTYD